MRVVLFRPTSLIGRLIAWQTRNEYSHAALLFDDGTLYEALEFNGVRKVPDWQPGAELVDIFEVSVDSDQAMREWLEKQVGKEYDYRSVIRFITRKQEDRKDSGRWFCSELVFAALKKGGAQVLERIEPWAVSPALLSYSPFLRKISL